MPSDWCFVPSFLDLLGTGKFAGGNFTVGDSGGITSGIGLEVTPRD